MLFSELKNKTMPELYKMWEEHKKEQLSMRIQMRIGQEFKSNKIKETRRNIAKILTRLAQIKSEKGV